MSKEAEIAKLANELEEQIMGKYGVLGLMNMIGRLGGRVHLEVHEDARFGHAFGYTVDLQVSVILLPSAKQKTSEVGPDESKAKDRV